ncbi:MAG: nucleoside monophosphate kinase [Patescibacteria group bacterium]|mgnify:CR=1 FL=1
MKQVVIFIAPPGAGKGTQSDILAKRMGFLHLETSQIIEEKFAKASLDDEDINKEKENFRTGKLVTPEKVTAWVIEKIRGLAEQGTSIVFSGSFRTLYEASQEIPVVEELYGREHIKIFYITLSEEESVRRNAGRRICKANRHPILADFSGDVCPHDGSELIKRSLDTPEVIRRRYQEYLDRTEPVLAFLKEQKYPIIEVNGVQGVEQLSHDIHQNFKAN